MNIFLTLICQCAGFWYPIIMDKRLSLLAVLVCFFAIAAPVFAHLPYMAGGNAGITVNKPEISKAYYGWLEGEPAVYSIDAKTPFLLYVNLLSPRIETGRIDYSAIIYKDGEFFANIPADNSLWLVTYEPFANDYYAKGPEWGQKVPSGKYEIKIYNSGNSGNYVLAVGKTEDLSLGEFLRALAVLPRVKEEFFGKPWWQAYSNLTGLMALIVFVFFMMVAYFAVSFLRRRRLKKKLDIQYAEHKNNGNIGGKDRGGLFEK